MSSSDSKSDSALGSSLNSSGSRPGSIKMVLREFHYQQLLFWRNRVGAVFTIIFSSVFLILLSATSAGSHIKFLQGISIAQYYTPAFMAYGLMAACFNNLAIATVVRRETGLLKRLRLSPLPGWALLSAVVLNAVAVTAIGAVVVLALGIFGLGVTLSLSSIIPLVVAMTLGSVCFSALGLAISTVVPNQDAAGPMISIVFFILLFLSGLWFPLTPGSILARVSNYFPVRRLILAVVTPFIGHGVSPWDFKDLFVVIVWGIVGTFIAVRRFRWSPWKDNHSIRSRPSE